MDHKSKYFKSLDQQDYADPSFLAKECSVESIGSLEVFKQNPRLLLRLRMTIDNDNSYEAHQLYKTIHFRCVTNNLINDSITLLYSGVVYFATKANLHCSFDLSKVFVETLKKSEINSLDANLKKKIKVIHALLKNGSEERNEFSVSLLKWSTNFFAKSKLEINDQENIYANYQKTFGHFDIHREFALNLWAEKNYVQARYHFLHSLDAQSFAHMIVECHLNFGFPSEYDLFLVQAVLQYLSLRNAPCAREFFKVYTENHPQTVKKHIDSNSKIELYDHPLVNFTNLLLKVIENGNVKAYRSLIDVYKPSLDRDTSLYSYLERVGEYYLSIKKAKQESKGFLGDLMRMFTSNPNEPRSSAVQASGQANESSEESDGNENNDYAEDDDVLD